MTFLNRFFHFQNEQKKSTPPVLLFELPPEGTPALRAILQCDKCLEISKSDECLEKVARSSKTTIKKSFPRTLNKQKFSV